MKRPLSWLLHLLVAAMGVGVAVSAVAVHRVEAHILGVSAPAGLVLGVAASFAVAWVLRSVVVPVRTTMSYAVSYAVGWVSAFGLILFGRPEGDYLIAADAVGYALMAAGLVVGLLGVLSARTVEDSKSGAMPT